MLCHADGGLTEGEVQSLGREVTDDVGGVTTPEREKALVPVGAAEAVADALVGGSQTTLLDLHCQVSLLIPKTQRTRHKH